MASVTAPTATPAVQPQPPSGGSAARSRSVRTWLPLGVALVVVVALGVLPLWLSPFQRSVAIFVGILTIAGAGLNLLTGKAGQISLASALFIGTGAYTAGSLGADRGWPIVVWLPAAFVVAALVGALLGPAALRVRGNYLAVVTLGALLVGEYVFEQWRSLTGGSTGRSLGGAVGSLDSRSFDLVGATLDRDVGWFWVIWAVAVLSLLAYRNIVRSAAGRALQAIHDHRSGAVSLGVVESRTVIAVFAFTSGMAGAAGALYGSYRGFVNPTEFGLVFSLQILTVIVVGGMATTIGPLLGALVVGALPAMIDSLSRSYDLPGVTGDLGGGGGFITVATLNGLLFGLILVVFLVVEPGGLARLGSSLIGRIRSKS